MTDYYIADDEVLMEVLPKAPTTRGSKTTFTGDVFADVIYVGEGGSRVNANMVRFAPGARTAWHSLALGQVLFVTEGVGLVQARGGEIAVVRQGDVVYTPPESGIGMGLRVKPS